jgi:hypothetical protein
MDAYDETDPTKGCILSANTEDGLTYESHYDWNIVPDGATYHRVTAMNITRKPFFWFLLNKAQSDIYNRYNGLPYSFFWPNLEPVPRWGPVLWYCSKTTWRIFIKMLLNLENATWHGLNLSHEGEWTDGNTLDNPKYVACTSSGLYQLLVTLYSLNPNIADPVWEADKKTWRNLKELITPDEIAHHSRLSAIWDNEWQ